MVCFIWEGVRMCCIREGVWVCCICNINFAWAIRMVYFDPVCAMNSLPVVNN